jgi:ABC-type nickel/cobalt efflux system permease component RcnA
VQNLADSEPNIAMNSQIPVPVLGCTGYGHVHWHRHGHGHEHRHGYGHRHGHGHVKDMKTTCTLGCSIFYMRQVFLDWEKKDF